MVNVLMHKRLRPFDGIPKVALLDYSSLMHSDIQTIISFTDYKLSIENSPNRSFII